MRLMKYSFGVALVSTLACGGVEPVAHWAFEEGMGCASEDVAQKGYEVTLGSGVKWARGSFGTALAFAGTRGGSGTFLPAVPGLDGKAFTISMWVRWNDGGKGKYPNIFACGPWGNGSAMLMHVADGGLSFRYGSKKGGKWHENSLSMISKIPAGKWVHVAVTFDKPKLTTFVNGKQVAQGNWNELLPLSQYTMLGSWTSGSLTHNGFLDDLRFYAAALSADEILHLAEDERYQEISGYQDDGTGGIAKTTLHEQTLPELASFESDYAVLKLDQAGRITSLREKVSGRELVSNVVPFMCVAMNNNRHLTPKRAVKDAAGKIKLTFPGKAGEVTLAVKRETFGFTFTLEKFAIPGARVYQFVQVFPACGKWRGAFVNGYSDEKSVVVVRPYKPQCNPKVEWNGHLCVEVDDSHGFEGWQVGLLAGPRAKAHDMLKQMTLTAGAPHSDVGGAWATGSEGARRSYLFAGGFTPKDVDYWVDLAERGGFSIIHISSDWSSCLGHYPVRTSYYPNGLADMRAAVDKIHAAGLYTGIHTLTACINPKDSWITPVCETNLVADYEYTLAKEVTAKTRDEIVVNELPGPKHALVFTYSCNGNVLRIGNELIMYSGIRREKPYAFTGLKRGAFGTKIGAYPAGARCDFVHQRYIAFYPKPDSPLADKLADCLSSVFNGADHEEFYFDGSEGMGSRYGIDALRWKIFSRLNKKSGAGPLIEASCRGANNWWFQTRTGTTDHPVWAAKRFHDAHIKDAIAIREREFLEPQMGWWMPRTAVSWARGHFPEDMEYFASQNTGIDAAMSIQGVDKRPGLPIGILGQLTTLGWYERMRLARAFAPGVCEKMAVPGAEFRLRQNEKGVWQLTPVEQLTFRAGIQEARAWEFNRPAASRTAVRIEALYGVENYETTQKMILKADDLPQMKTASAKGVKVQLVANKDATHGDTLILSAQNESAPQKGSWVRAERKFPFPYEAFPDCNAFGVWVKGDGSGALFVLQVSPGHEYHHSYSDHQIRLNFTGWRYFPLLVRERDVENHNEYQWPYNGIYSLYRSGLDVKHIEYARMYLNDVPVGKKATVEIASVATLKQRPKALVENVALTVNGKAVKVPFQTLTGGDYVELENGTWTHFDEMGTPIGIQVTGDEINLSAGANVCTIAASEGARLETTFFALGETFPALKEDLTDAMKKQLACEVAKPSRYFPQQGLDALPPVVVRPGEKAQVELVVTGPVKGLTFKTSTWFGLSEDVVTLPDLSAAERFLCRDGKHWKKTDSYGRTTLAEGTFETALPLVKGAWKPTLTCAAPAEANAVISIVKRYAR